jgi:hypothetical protein
MQRRLPQKKFSETCAGSVCTRWLSGCGNLRKLPSISYTDWKGPKQPGFNNNVQAIGKFKSFCSGLWPDGSRVNNTNNGTNDPGYQVPGLPGHPAT